MSTEVGYVECEPWANLAIAGDATLAAWVRLDLADSSEETGRHLIFHGAPGEDESVNVLYSMILRGQRNPPDIRWTHESGSGLLTPGVANNVSLQIVPPDIFDEAWHHVALVRDAATFTLRYYVDTELVGTADYQQPATGGEAGRLILGANGGYNPDAYTGARSDMDEVYIFARALSAAEVAVLAVPEGVPLS